uniref:Aurora kinase n=1 Tax=Steinernema glaseri TaxID=37863 RepID=A0A1I7Z0X5_9BILA
MSTSTPAVQGESSIPSSALSALTAALQQFQCSAESKLVSSTKHSYVYHSHSRLFARDIAIKLLLTENIPEHVVKKFVARELIVVRSVDHPHLLKALDVAVHGNVIIIAMPFCAGGHLLNALKQKGKFSELQTARIFRQVVEAIGYLHSRNVAHRDVKLENILFTDQGDVKLIDYGFAIPMPNGRRRARSQCGTK